MLANYVILCVTDVLQANQTIARHTRSMRGTHTINQQLMYSSGAFLSPGQTVAYVKCNLHPIASDPNCRAVETRPDQWTMVHDAASRQLFWTPPGSLALKIDSLAPDPIERAFLDTQLATEVHLSGFRAAHADLGYQCMETFKYLSSRG